MTNSCIIIEDDLLSLRYLEKCIERHPELELVRSFTDPIQAIEELTKQPYVYDFLFLDVEMPGISGLNVWEKIADKFRALVLVSAHTKYAISGYALNAKQFLAKPFSYHGFESVVRQLIKEVPAEKACIMIRMSAKGNFVRLYTDKIIAVEGASNYVKIHLTDSIIMPYYKLSEIQSDLNSYAEFRRASRSFIVSVRHIQEISSSHVSLTNNLTVAIGELYKKEFMTGLTDSYLSLKSKF